MGHPDVFSYHYYYQKKTFLVSSIPKLFYFTLKTVQCVDVTIPFLICPSSEVGEICIRSLIPCLVVCNGSVYIALSLSPRLAVTHFEDILQPSQTLLSATHAEIVWQRKSKLDKVMLTMGKECTRTSVDK